MSIKDNLVPITIDLGIARRGEISESFLRIFGSAIESVLGRMFGTNSIPVNIRGTRNEIQSFANTLNGEKRYIEAYQKYGLDNPLTYNSKYALDKAIQNFEKVTGIKYPLK